MFNIDEDRVEVRVKDKLVRGVSPKEFDILVVLKKANGGVRSREKIIEGAWPAKNKVADTRTVDQHIARLRYRLSKIDPKARDLIVTVSKRGYKLAI